ncbi:hypothetical protein D3C77_173460 [compost metagenome]
MLCEGDAIDGQFGLEPLGAFQFEALIEGIGNLPAGTDKHRLAFDGRAFRHPLLVMLGKVLGQRLDAIRVAQDRVHAGRGFLALFNLVLAGPLRFALLVVLLDLFQLTVIEYHLGGAPFIDDAYRDLVVDRLGHGVAVDGGAEHIQGGVDRGAGKAHIGGVG